MPTIRIDDSIWTWLKSYAQPFEDTPNAVLERIRIAIASLRDPGKDHPAHWLFAPRRADSMHDAGPPRPVAPGRIRRSGHRDYSGLSGRQLNIEWNVNAKHPLFHKDGTYYNHLQYFPGALFDMDGYLLFKTEEQYRTSTHLQRGKQLHVPGGIESVPGYVRVRKPEQSKRA